MNQTESLIQELRELERQLGVKASKRLDLQLVARLLQRSASFANDCATCQRHLDELQSHLHLLMEHVEQDHTGATIDKKEHLSKIHLISSHLQKDHQLITDGYYTSIYMSLGMSLGLVFGLTVTDNLALGLPIGMSIGLAIGAGLDADAKKKGKVI